MPAAFDCPTPGGQLRVRRATNFLTRARGLLFGPALDADEALLIAPCSSIHTFGMRYPIDVVFLDRHARVVQVSPEVGARRIRFGRGAVAVLELRAGGAARLGLRAGVALDAMAVREAPIWRGFRSRAQGVP